MKFTPMQMLLFFGKELMLCSIWPLVPVQEVVIIQVRVGYVVVV
jgi:hypothetical protein